MDDNNIEKNSKKQIKAGALISYATIGINLLIGMIYTPWMINTIGSSDYGLYTLASSIISIVTIDFGLSAATSCFVSKKLAENDYEGVNNVVGLIMRLYLYISGIAFIALVIVFPMLDKIYVGLTPTELPRFRIVYIIVASYSILSFPFISLNGIFSAYEKFVQMKLCDLFNRLTSMLLVIIFLLNGKGLYALVFSNAVVGLITICIRLLLINKMGVRFNIKFNDRELIKDIFTFSIWTTVAAICMRLIFNLVPSILGIVSNSKEITYYGVASTIDGYFYSFAAALGSLFLAKVSRLFRENDKDSEKIDDLAIKVGRIQLIIVSLIYIGFFSIGKEFVDLWMGGKYQIVYYCLLLLAFPDIIEYSQQIYYTALVAAKKVKLHAIASINTTVITVPLVFLLSYFWGSWGASIAICIGCVVRTTAMCIAYKRGVNANLKKFFLKTYPRIIPVFVTCIIYSVIINKYFVADSWFSLSIKGVLVTAVYALSVFTFFINDRKAIINRLLKK